MKLSPALPATETLKVLICDIFRDKMSTCVNCKERFEKKVKGYKRSSLESLGDCAKKNFSQLNPHKNFVCWDCKPQFESTVKRQLFTPEESQVSTNATKKRKHISFTTNSSKSLSPRSRIGRQLFKDSPNPNLAKIDFKRTASAYLRNSNYEKLFKVLIKNSTKAKRELVKVAGSVVQNELRCVSTKSSQRTITAAASTISLSTLNAFSWKTFLTETLAKTPYTYQILYNCVPPAKNAGKYQQRGPAKRRR